MHNIVWLASYPKSGNTWCRAFLTNLLRNAERPASINQLDTDGIAASRPLFDDVTGIASSDLTSEEIARLRPRVSEFYSSQAESSLIIKTHDALLPTPSGEMLISPEATRGILYIIRNPLDLVVSFAHHLQLGIDETIRCMADSELTFCSKRGRLFDQLPQRLLDWSGHVTSWVDAKDYDVHVMRFEDMAHLPIETFAAAARHLGFPDDSDRVAKALEFSSFDELKRQEEEDGFRERPLATKSFFRAGRVGDWRDVLEPGQARRVVETHADVMRRFGYLGEDGEPVI